MADTQTATKALKGGEFLIRESDAASTFIPEEFHEEQEMIRQMVEDFVQNVWHPRWQEVEKMENNATVELLEQAAELGLLGSHMPQKYGGMELDTNTNTLICDELGPAGSWIVSFAAHTGIGMLPILYFGTEAQKEQYLPRLISGELKAAYCLTEPGSGSDALAAKSRADLSSDGSHYLLNGQKMWITNSGFADLFIVFAQVNGDQFTGFVVERNSEGLSLGAEEPKLGIKGSSTRQVFFENVKVPKENVLGEVGKGHHIAFNVLNVGRFKLAALCIGGAKASANTAIQYANGRVQFNQSISSFGAIQYKIAEQAIRIFTSESTLYRTSNFMQQKIKELEDAGSTFAESKLEAAEEYAIECAMLKVIGSEILDYVVDETLQIHGGMGYSEEGTAARAYRDARINRIYEGTNEINRLLTIDMLFRRALKGALDIVNPAWAVQKELSSMPSMERPQGEYGEERKAVLEFKKAGLMVAGSAAKMQMDGKLNLKEEQEILSNLADMLIDTFMAESTLLRVEKLATMTNKPHEQAYYDAILRTFLNDATARIHKNGSDALASFTDGDLLRTLQMGLKRFTKYPAVNVKQSRRLIAAKLIEANKFF